MAEYDYDTDIAVQRAEAGRIAFAEGREQGITQGISQGSRPAYNACACTRCNRPVQEVL